VTLTQPDPIAPARPPRSPYLEGNYAPVGTEITAIGLEVVGELPTDLEGVYVRTGSNPRFEPKGRYHWFDGDGMLHGIELGNGTATYRNRYVQTAGLAEDLAAGESTYTGILERPDFTHATGPYKDTANTDLAWHAGRLLALWWLSGSAHRVRLPDLETVGVDDFDGTLACNISAHAKTDPRTGELMFFDYSPFPPDLRYGVAGPDGRVAHLTEIDLPGPRLQHDIAVTETRSLVFDMSMMWDPDELAKGRVKLRFFRDVPSRIGVLPRYGTNADVRWFEVDPFFMYHTIAAWDEGDEVVLIGCQIPEPTTGDGAPSGLAVVPSIANLRLEPYLYEWRLDLATGRARERRLDDRLTEFPRINDDHLAGPARFSYNPTVRPGTETLLFDGLVTYDLTNGTTIADYRYPAGWFGGETTFAPATHATAEDDGYVLTFVAEEATGASELYVWDARAVGDGPVARLPIPQRVPTGYHTQWITAAQVAAQRS
jgi:carotenoid cleavage dioxygenase